MKSKNSPMLAIIAVVVIVVAGFFIFKSFSGGGTEATSGPILPVDPKSKDPTFDPNRNAPPGIAGVGKGG